jgi:hypothetical protein
MARHGDISREVAIYREGISILLSIEKIRQKSVFGRALTISLSPALFQEAGSLSHFMRSISSAEGAGCSVYSASAEESAAARATKVRRFMY